MGKSDKEKLIQKDGDFSKSRVKEYAERNSENTKNNIVSRGKDITFNKL